MANNMVCNHNNHSVGNKEDNKGINNKTQAMACNNKDQDLDNNRAVMDNNNKNKVLAMEDNNQEWEDTDSNNNNLILSCKKHNKQQMELGNLLTLTEMDRLINMNFLLVLYWPVIMVDMQFLNFQFHQKFLINIQMAKETCPTNNM